MSMHLEANRGEIAPRVLLAGDPERVTYVADTLLTDADCVSRQRGALCYTGIYAGVSVSVVATGMGIPSMLIYATELCRDYGCEVLVRAGTGAGYRTDMRRHDIVLAQATCTTSSLNDHLFLGTYAPIADFSLLRAAYELGQKSRAGIFVGNTVCNDRLYRLPESYRSAQWAEYGVLCSEMEGAALYTVAAQYGRRALMMVSMLSHITVGEQREVLTPLAAEPDGPTIDDMLVLALETLRTAEV